MHVRLSGKCTERPIGSHMAGRCAGALRKLASPSTPRLLSTVAKGTHFEEATARALLDIGMSLERWGAGAHDQGLDLRVSAGPSPAKHAMH